MHGDRSVSAGNGCEGKLVTIMNMKLNILILIRFEMSFFVTLFLAEQ